MSEESIVWINGEHMPANEVPLSIFDLGVAVGLGVFETLIAYRGVMPSFNLHMDRFQSAAAIVKLNLPPQEIMMEAVMQTLAVNDLTENKRVRVRITLGAGEHLVAAKKVSRAVENYLIISAVPQNAPAPHAELAVVPMRCNEHGALAGVKTTSYAENILAYRHAAKQGGDEAVMLNTSGHLCECSMSNLFLVKDSEVLTPSLSSGCLPGVTRSTVLELCRGNQIPVKQLDLSEGDLFSADEIFITSSAREVQPARMVGSSLEFPGAITKLLADEYRVYIEEEL